jgi:hypothetical protein
VDLTSRLLTQCGQGPNCQNQATKHTPFSLQVVTLLVFLFFLKNLFHLNCHVSAALRQICLPLMWEELMTRCMYFYVEFYGCSNCLCELAWGIVRMFM